MLLGDGRPFKLSSLTARTLRPHTPAQELHVDVRRESPDWPLLGFILMIDAFRPDNGATRFIPGSHRWASNPDDTISDFRAIREDQVFACGPAGSLIAFNGSTWHGHSQNTTNQPRRSLQGAFIPHDGNAATDFGARMLPDTRARISELARHVLERSRYRPQPLLGSRRPGTAAARSARGTASPPDCRRRFAATPSTAPQLSSSSGAEPRRFGSRHSRVSSAGNTAARSAAGTHPCRPCRGPPTRPGSSRPTRWPW
jgi:hypothetical protein